MSPAVDERGHQGRRRARRTALQALYQWQVTAQEPAEIERQFLEEQDMSRVDIDYFRELLYRVPAVVGQLDARLAPLLDRPLDQVDPVERAILRLGAYELTERPEIPYRVVVNEAVEIAKVFGAEQGHRYVNAALDRLAREVRAIEVGGGEPRPGRDPAG
jgi:N utilization substance protein B